MSKWDGRRREGQDESGGANSSLSLLLLTKQLAAAKLLRNATWEAAMVAGHPHAGPAPAGFARGYLPRPPPPAGPRCVRLHTGRNAAASSRLQDQAGVPAFLSPPGGRVRESSKLLPFTSFLRKAEEVGTCSVQENLWCFLPPTSKPSRPVSCSASPSVIRNHWAQF